MSQLHFISSSIVRTKYKNVICVRMVILKEGVISTRVFSKTFNAFLVVKDIVQVLVVELTTYYN